MLIQLENMVSQAASLKYLTGFGDLNSARALQEKFARKADGDEDSAVQRLKECIDIVKVMRDTYEIAARQITETDQSTAGELGAAGPA